MIIILCIGHEIKIYLYKDILVFHDQYKDIFISSENRFFTTISVFGAKATRRNYIEIFIILCNSKIKKNI